MLVAVAACGDAATVGEPPDPESDLLQSISRPVESGRFHLVRMVQRGGEYAFDPAEINVQPGDVVRFVMSGAQPESVVFDPGGSTPDAAAFIRENGLDLGVLLTEPGQAYDVSFEGAPAGMYRFFSRPHVALGMSGLVIVATDP